MTQTSAEEAQRIYQDLLDAIWAAMEQRDFQQYKAYFALPHQVETFEGRRTIADLKDLRAVYDNLQEGLSHQGRGRMVRHCLAAEFEDAQTIHGSHETHVLDRSLQITARYPAYSILRLNGGQWQVASSQYAADQTDLVPGIWRGVDQ